MPSSDRHPLAPLRHPNHHRLTSIPFPKPLSACHSCITFQPPPVTRSIAPLPQHPLSPLASSDHPTLRTPNSHARPTSLSPSPSETDLKSRPPHHPHRPPHRCPQGPRPAPGSRLGPQSHRQRMLGRCRSALIPSLGPFLGCLCGQARHGNKHVRVECEADTGGGYSYPTHQRRRRRLSRRRAGSRLYVH
jgi:hypothetical protein